MNQIIRFSNPVKPEEIAEAYARGMIAKKDLKNREFYKGRCRNASLAMWVNEISRFVYIREKWGSKFLEDICHPEDDNNYDLFIPTSKAEDIEPDVLFKTDLNGLIAYINKWRNNANLQV